MMGEIYQEARAVLVWLGKGDYMTRLTFKSLRKFGTWYVQHSGRLGISRKEESESLIKRLRQQSPESNPFIPIFDSPWYGRIWTVQEVAFSRTCVVLCGSSSMPWDLFVNAAAFLNLPQLGKLRLTSGSINAFGTIFLRDMLLKHLQKRLDSTEIRQPENVTRRLNELVFLRSSDPKDKIFGLYSIATALGLTMPVPDYSKPVEIVYEEATLAFILNTRSIGVLEYACSNQRRLGLPTWVPDWGDWREFVSCHKLEAKSGSLFPSDLIAKQGRLRLAGKAVDVVQHRASTDFAKPDYSVHPILHQIQFIRGVKEWSFIIGKFLSYPTGEPVPMAFVRTLFYGSGSDVWGSVESRLSQLSIWLKTLSYPGYTHPALVRAAKLALHLVASDDDLRRPHWTPEMIIDCTIALALTRPREFFDSEAWDIEVLHRSLHVGSQDKAFFTTRSGYMGTGFHTLQPGDLIVLCAGATMPLIIREQGDYFRFIGPGYVHGLMNAEAWPKDETKLKEYILI
jgi:hypothetical protein